MLAFDSLLFRTLATTALLIAIVAALWLAKAVFVPIFVALLLAVLLRLPMAAMERAGVPRLLSILVMIAALCGTLMLFSLFISGPARTIAKDYPQMVEQFRGKLISLRQTLAEAQKVGGAIAEIGEEVSKTLDTDTEQTEEVVVREESSVFNWVSSFAESLITIAVTLTILGFVLAIRNPFLTLATLPCRTLSSKLHAARVWKSAEKDISHYFLVTTLINAGLGLVVGLVLWQLDVSMPIFWGFLVGVLNYMPFVGPTIGATLLFAFSVVQFDTLFQMLLPAAAYLAINFFEANIVTPNLVGRRVNIAPLAIVLSLLFWGWLWGFVGLFICIPLLVIVNAVAERVDSLAALNRMLTPRTDREGRSVFFQKIGTERDNMRSRRERRAT